MSRYCSACGKTSIPEARYCGGCGLKLASCKRSFETAELLAIAGSIIAFLGGIIGLSLSMYYDELHGFNPMVASILMTSLFGLVGFFYSILGLTMIVRKRLRQPND
jgi:hypothetical protein